MTSECLGEMVRKRRKILQKKEGIEQEILDKAKSSGVLDELKMLLEKGNQGELVQALGRIAGYAPENHITRVTIQDRDTRRILCKVGQPVVSLKPATMEFTIPGKCSYLLTVEAAPAANVESTFNVVWLGVAAAGKSSLIERLRQGEFASAPLTVGLNVTSFCAEGVRLVNCDVSGHRSFRSIWDSLIVGSPDLAIYVVDSSNVSALMEAKEVLESYVLKAQTLKGVPILFVMNKQDLNEAMNGEQFSQKLNLQKIASERGWKVVDASAKTGAGLPDMLDWMIQELKMKKGGTP